MVTLVNQSQTMAKAKAIKRMISTEYLVVTDTLNYLYLAYKHGVVHVHTPSNDYFCSIDLQTPGRPMRLKSVCIGCDGQIFFTAKNQRLGMREDCLIFHHPPVFHVLEAAVLDTVPGKHLSLPLVHMILDYLTPRPAGLDAWDKIPTYNSCASIIPATSTHLRVKRQLTMDRTRTYLYVLERHGGRWSKATQSVMEFNVSDNFTSWDRSNCTIAQNLSVAAIAVAERGNLVTVARGQGKFIVSSVLTPSLSVTVTVDKYPSNPVIIEDGQGGFFLGERFGNVIFAIPTLLKRDYYILDERDRDNELTLALTTTTTTTADGSNAARLVTPMDDAKLQVCFITMAPHCLVCGKLNVQFISCGKCRRAYYCSTACQLHGQKQHRLGCFG